MLPFMLVIEKKWTKLTALGNDENAPLVGSKHDQVRRA